MTQKTPIYLDFAATTPLDPEVFSAMEPFFTESFGNASSAHAFGQKARRAIDSARVIVAKHLGVKPREIVFTSGATESNNIILQTLPKTQTTTESPHVIISALEHHCVLNTAKFLEETGVNVDYVNPASNGIVNLEEIEKLITKDTVLISIMYANNEIGTIQPIREIGKRIQKLNETRENKIYFHTDAAQALQYLEMNADYLHVDAISLSAHKIYGPKGTGALYVRSGTPVKSLMHGGSQEYELRPGTQNVPGIVGFGKAIELLQPEKDKIHVKELRDVFLETLNAGTEFTITGSMEHRLPNNLHISFIGVKGENLLIALDIEGVAISLGAACASGAMEASHVLEALGIQETEPTGIRITFGRTSTLEEVREAASRLYNTIERLDSKKGKVV